MTSDVAEAHGVAEQNPEQVARMEAIMAEAHRPHPNWQPRGGAPKSPKR